MGIENSIPYGRENAISRDALVYLTGESDRRNRKNIEEARCAGHIIINAQDGEGYFRIDPNNINQSELAAIYRQYCQNKSRALSVLTYQKHLRKILKENGIKA